MLIKNIRDVKATDTQAIRHNECLEEIGLAGHIKCL